MESIGTAFLASSLERASLPRSRACHHRFVDVLSFVAMPGALDGADGADGLSLNAGERKIVARCGIDAAVAASTIHRGARRARDSIGRWASPV
jgi:hypothetical protein